MKEFKNPTDEFFRDALQDHRMPPSDAARKAFLTEAVQVPPPPGNGKKGLLLISVLAILALTGLLFWANSPKNLNPAAANRQAPASVNPSTLNKSSVSTSDRAVMAGKKPTTASVTSPAASSQIPVNSVSTPDPEKKSHNVKTAEVASENHPPNQNHAAVPVAADPKTGSGTMKATTAINTELPQPSQPTLKISTAPVAEDPQPPGPTTKTNLPLTGTQNEKIPAELSVEPATSLTNQPAPETIAGAIIRNPDTTVQPAVHPGAVTDSDPVQKQHPWNLSFGVYYMPEWMFNTLEGTKFVNNFGVEGTFHFGKFSVRTGAGLSVAKGTNEVIVEYNDYLGTYNKLDSMDFTWNDPIHNYVPTMYISKQDVWDSLMKLDYAKVVKRYTYLQIPLVMGYDFWQTEHVSMGLRAGPVMSILMATRQLSEAYDPGRKKIVSVNDIAPEQVSLNWQVMAGINTAFLLSKKVRFEVEPSVRYYFNSVYEKPVNNTKPWSVGIRAAFVVDF